MKPTSATEPRSASLRWLAAAAVLVCAIGAWIAWSSRDAAPGAVDARRERAGAEVSEGSEPSSTDAPDPLSSGATSASPSAVSERSELSAQNAWRLRGVLELVDWTGAALPPAPGEIEVVGWTARGSERVTAAVDAAGRWSAQVDLSAGVRDFSIGAVRVALSGAVELEAPRERMYPPANGELTVRARVWPRNTLRVLDAATGEDLHELHLQAEVLSNLGGLPGSYDGVRTSPSQRLAALRIADGLSSPIDLGPLRARIEELGAQRLRVVAPGRTWQATPAEFDQAWVHTRRLEPAVELVLELADPQSAGAGLALVARLLNGELPSALGAFDEHSRIDWPGLEPRNYRLEVSMASASAWSATGRLAWGELKPFLATPIELRAGERRTLRVTLGPDEFELELAGRLYVPSALELLELADVRLLFAAPSGEARARRVVLLRNVADDRPGAECIEWRGIGPRRGPFVVELSQPRAWVEYDGAHDARLANGVEFGELAEVSLELVSGNQAYLESRRVEFAPAGALGDLARSSPLTWDAQRQRFVGRLAPGRYRVSVTNLLAPQERDFKHVVDVRGPLSELRLVE
jgi:hypothetical protein